MLRLCTLFITIAHLRRIFLCTWNTQPWDSGSATARRQPTSPRARSEGTAGDLVSSCSALPAQESIRGWNLRWWGRRWCWRRRCLSRRCRRRTSIPRASPGGASGSTYATSSRLQMPPPCPPTAPTVSPVRSTLSSQIGYPIWVLVDLLDYCALWPCLGFAASFVFANLLFRCFPSVLHVYLGYFTLNKTC